MCKLSLTCYYRPLPASKSRFDIMNYLQQIIILLNLVIQLGSDTYGRSAINFDKKAHNKQQNQRKNTVICFRIFFLCSNDKNLIKKKAFTTIQNIVTNIILQTQNTFIIKV